MKTFSNFIYCFSIFLTSIALVFSTNVMAKNINLYEQAKADSKIIGNVDSSAGLVTIFTTTDGNWVKVGDPRNGNTGWIKSADLGNQDFHFNLIKVGNGNQQYQILQYGNMKPVTQEQVSNAMKQMQAREQALQKNMQKMIHDMYLDLHQEWMDVPIFVIPMPDNNPAVPVKQSSQTGNNIKH